MTEERIFPKLAKRFDWPLFSVSIFLTLLGILFIYSATLPMGKADYFFLKQSIAFGLGLLLIAGVVLFPYTFFREYFYFLLVLSVVLLLGVLFFGKTIRGTRGWYSFGSFYFQPAELAKIFYILILAGYLGKEERSLKEIRHLFLPLFFTLIFVALILRQPDFSSTLVFFPILIVMLYLGGIELLPFLALLFFFSLVSGLVLFNSYLSLLKEKTQLLTFFEQVLNQYPSMLFFLLGFAFLLLFIYWLVVKLRFSPRKKNFLIFYGLFAGAFFSAKIFSLALKSYQRKRLLAFLDPDIDPLGAGYNVLQSRIAIGSGKIFGKGLFSGTQAQLGFLPERHTDFVFSLVSEEWGFLGASLVISLYAFLIYRSLLIAHEARDRFGGLVAAGIATLFTFNCFVNIGMAMGIMPAVGLPLPFLSYGGSHLIAAYFALGLLLSIHLRRFVH